ncbi:MAG: universal stress protein [Thaumarchaeota archaeon]|nr:universal stress protein [Nitrososphaerota archaeon]
MQKNVRIKNILVPLDGSKNSVRGLTHAIDLAKQNKATILGIHVMPTSFLYSACRPSNLKEEMLKNAKRIMKSVRKQTEKEDIIFKEKILSGFPGRDIVEFANKKRNNVGMIVIGTRNKGDSEFVFGSISNYVLNKTKVPLLVV